MQAPTDDERTFDVLIAGGGMAGLLLARQLRRELPECTVALVERTERPLPLSAHKVGESNAELGSQYLERLGLAEYLERAHIVKLGLRFFVGGGGVPLSQRTELGPALEPIVRGYQIDRGRLEEDLRAMAEEDGVTLWEGTMVRRLDLGEGQAPHTIVLQTGDHSRTVAARWFVDASGRSAFLRRRLGLERDSEHRASSGWFRVPVRVHMAELDPQAPSAWSEVPLAPQRWRSTCHLMGEGYWVWLIALSSGYTSIGVVVHEERVGFDRVRTLPRVLEFLREREPALARRLEGVDPLDFRCMHDYSYGIERSFSPQRFTIVGDAGAFVDPLYSPGTDFIALSNSFTVELVRADRAGEALAPIASSLDAQYQGLLQGSLGVYRKAAPVYGHARALAAKVYWDNFAYWSFTCQYFLQGLFRVRDDLQGEISRIQQRFVELSGYVQALSRAWAELHPIAPSPGFITMPPFPSHAVDAHLDLKQPLDPRGTVERMRMRLRQGECMVAEFVVRLLLEYGPDDGGRILAAAGADRFDLPHDPGRLEVEPTVGLARRRALSREVRDVERALGRVTRHPAWEDALRSLDSMRSPGARSREDAPSLAR